MCIEKKKLLKTKHKHPCNIFAFPITLFIYFLPNGSILLWLFTFYLHSHISKHRMHSFSLSHSSSWANKTNWNGKLNIPPFFSPVLSLLQKSNFTQYGIVVCALRGHWWQGFPTVACKRSWVQIFIHFRSITCIQPHATGAQDSLLKTLLIFTNARNKSVWLKLQELQMIGIKNTHFHMLKK